MSVKIVANDCCGSLCVHWYRYNEDGDWIDAAAESDYNSADFRGYLRAPGGSAKEKKYMWRSWATSLRKLLKRLFESGKITAEEARQLWQDFLTDHPTPKGEDAELGDAYEVTREFGELLAARTLVPEKVEADR